MSQQTAHDDINQVNNEYHKELLKNQEVENIVENTLNDEEISFTKEATNTNELSENNEAINNDLSEFGVDTKSPDLFSNDSEISNSDELLLTENEDQDEDDLEIPAFLRRQKN